MTSGEAKEPRSVARGRDIGRALAAAVLAIALGACGRGGIGDPANELPFGHVDVPAAGAQVNATTPVAGWVLDDRGVRELRLYVDNHLVNTGRVTDERPDVSTAYPPYAKGSNRHGFTLLAGFDAPGPHTIIVQAVDNDGATRDIGVVNVTAIDK